MVKTKCLRISPTDPEPDALAEAAAVLHAGGLVAFPTETVYGLGANALDASAVKRIYEAKGRPSTNPLIIHLAHVESVSRVASAWPEAAARLAERFWPGPLTLVLPRGDQVPDIVTGGGPTVAVRLPGHPVARALLLAVDLPLAAPSANRSGRLSPTSAEHVLADLDGRIDLILDGGSTPGGIESTVLDVTRTPPRLLRPGLIGPLELEAIIGPINRDEPSLHDGPLPSPGLLARHYAPRTPLVQAADEGRALLLLLIAQGIKPSLLTHVDLDVLSVPQERLPAEPAAYAAGLYAALHRLDALGLGRIVVSAVPQGEEWLAIRDRLRRAAV